MNNKSITILVSMYNGGHFIRAKLENLLQQTIINDVHIVFLNCQNNHDERSVYEYLLTDSKISCNEILYKSFVGLYKSWNDGIQITNSQYICNSNIDDMWHPEYLEKCIAFLNSESRYSVVSSKILITDMANQSNHAKWSKIIGVMPFFQYPLSTAGPCPVWRRSLHDVYGYFDDCLTIGDAKMWEKWHSGQVEFGLIPDESVLYYSSQDSLERRIDKTTGRLYRDIDLDKIKTNET